jgi:hypothetical protein
MTKQDKPLRDSIYLFLLADALRDAKSVTIELKDRCKHLHGTTRFNKTDIRTIVNALMEASERAFLDVI